MGIGEDVYTHKLYTSPIDGEEESDEPLPEWLLSLMYCTSSHFCSLQKGACLLSNWRIIANITCYRDISAHLSELYAECDESGDPVTFVTKSLY